MPNILDNVVRALRPHKTLMDRFQQLDGLVDKSWYRFQKAKLRENGKSKDYMDQYYGDVDKLSQSLKDEWTRLIDDVNPRNDGNLYLGYIRKCLDRGDRYNDCKEKFPKYIKPFVEDFEKKIKTDNNMNNENEIEINGETYVKKSAIATEPVFNAADTEGLKYVICRGYYCGVHAGYLKNQDGNHVTLVNSRRLWSWKAKEGISLSAVAKHGIHEDCELPNVLPEIWLGDVYEVIPCTKAAMESIVEAKVRGQN